MVLSCNDYQGISLYEWCTKEIDKDKVIESSYRRNIEILG